MAVLPPGVSAATFAAAIKEFEAAVGKEWVFTSDEDLASYRDHFSYIKNQPNELDAVSGSRPGLHGAGAGDRARAANKYKIPLYAISTGKNFAYGGPSPNVRGSVTVDLKRMNRVLEVNDKRYYAVVEPGVSYIDLYRHIQDHGLKVWVDTPDPGWGSPIGNALDHGIGYTMGYLSRSLRRALRHGSGAAERRDHAHRHGRAAGVEELARVQARFRAGSRGSLRSG